LTKREQVDVRVFLLDDAVGCAISGQIPSEGYYHLDRMLTGILYRAHVGC
jgi:uncharacterized protein involved in oxidation of intracellular sulfur